jgi:hypothetical protein
MKAVRTAAVVLVTALVPAFLPGAQGSAAAGAAGHTPATAVAAPVDILAVPSGGDMLPVPFLIVGDTATGVPHALEDLETSLHGGSVIDADVAPVTNVVAYVKKQAIGETGDGVGDSPPGIALVNRDTSAHRWVVPPRVGIDVSGVQWNVIGTKLLWQQRRASSHTSYLWTLAVTKPGAAPTIVPGSANIGYASFSRRTYRTILGVEGSSVIVTLTDGVRTAVVSMRGVVNPRFTPHDQAIVFTDTVDHAIERIAGDGTGTPETIASDRSYLSGDVAPDGSAVYATVPLEEPGYVYRIPLSQGSTGTPVLQPRPSADNRSNYGVPSAAAPDTTPPHPISRLQVALNGTHPTVSFRLPRDIDFSHVVVYRLPEGAGLPGPGKGALVYAGRQTSFVDTIALKDWVMYGVFVVDGSGNLSTGAFTLASSALPPRITAPVLASSTSTTRNFLVTCRDPAVDLQGYIAQWAPHGGAFRPWPDMHCYATFGEGGQPTTPVFGRTYDIRVRASDDNGHVTAPTTVSVTEPYDDRAATVTSGWHAWRRESAWLGTWRGTRTAGAALSMRLTGRRYYVVGDRLPQGGRFAVYLGGVRVATVDTHASALQVRQVLWRSALLHRATRTLRIVNLATAGRPQIDIDALAARPVA